MRLLLSTILFLTFIFSINQSAEAQTLQCPQRGIEQLTETPTGNSEDPSINEDGRYVAFRSIFDFNDNNPNNTSQIYLFDRLTRVQTQITDDPDEGSFQPDINPDGNYVAFASNSDINGGNPNKVRQIYIYNRTTGLFTQVTADPNDGSNNPSINANASFVAFSSDADFTGENMDNSQEVFLANVAEGTFIQITADPNPMFTIQSGNPSISGDANLIAFESESDITGENPNNINQVFFYNVNTDTTTQISQGQTNSQGSSQPAISLDGKFIVYRSSQNINGGNPDESSEIFLYEIATGENTQITFTNGGTSQNPSINDDASLLAFESNGNFVGTNPEIVREIWVYEVATARFIQVTNVSDGLSEHARISGDGSSVAFESRSDINGGNPDLNREVYVAECMFRGPIPTLSEWSLIALAAILGLVGFMVIRRRAVSFQ